MDVHIISSPNKPTVSCAFAFPFLSLGVPHLDKITIIIRSLSLNCSSHKMQMSFSATIYRETFQKWVPTFRSKSIITSATKSFFFQADSFLLDLPLSFQLTESRLSQPWILKYCLSQHSAEMIVQEKQDSFLLNLPNH